MARSCQGWYIVSALEADLLAVVRELLELDPVEHNPNEGERCFFCGKDLDYGPGLTLVEAHESDCVIVKARKAIAKATNGKGGAK